MARLLTIDAESAGESPYEFDSIDGDGGSFGPTAASAKHGSYGYESAFTGTTGDAYGIKAFTEQNDVYLRLYFEVEAWGTAQGNYVATIVIADGANAAMVFRMYKTASAVGYRVYVNNGGTTIINKISTDVFTIGTTYCLEIHYVSDDSVGGAEVFINGVSDASSFETDTSTYAANAIWIGPYAGNFDNGDKWYWDDIAVDTSQIGVISGVSIPVIMHHMDMMRS